MYDFDEGWLAKLDELRAQGVDPFPAGLRTTHLAKALHETYEGVDDPSGGEQVAIGGRLMFRNRMGRAMFLRIADRSGLIQAYVRKDEVGDESFEQLKKLDVGDIVWVRGTMMRTRTGELTVKASQARLAGKILTPFPDRWHSLTDVETRARQRYVDLFMNEDTRDAFRTRSRMLSYMREFFERRDFVEVETPILQALPGGAVAKPFVTHHNTLDIDLYMRVAPELYLKRLIVGGMGRVFELNRSFRNEGMSVKHNPEFTMLEFYQAWSTYEELMALTEELLSGLAGITGGLVREFDGRTIDWTPPYRKARMGDLIAEATGLSPAELRDPAAMEAWWRERHPDAEHLPGTWGKWWELLFDALVEDTLVNPTFVTHYPYEISPLARRNPDDPELTDRFELVANGWELANGFNELNDPVDQAHRFELQAKARAAGDDESMYFDADYVRALTYGMPPTAGEGIGVDRVVMLFTGQTSIREVILFPTLRPRIAGEPPGEQ